MKISDAIKYSYIKTIRDKKNIYFIIILTVCLFILIASLFFRIVYFDLVDDSIEMSKDSRKLAVRSKEEYKYVKDKTYDLGYDELLKIEHVVDTYSSKYDFYPIISKTFKNEKYDGNVLLLYGSEESQPKYINGEKIRNEDTGVAICSKRFYPNGEDKGMTNKDIEILNGDDLIGTTFEIEKEKYSQNENGFLPDGIYKKEYRIIGTFDAYETREPLSSCYISPRDMKELYDLTIVNYDYVVPSQFAIIDKYINIEAAIDDIKKLGFEVLTNASADYETLNIIKSICLLITSVIIVTIIFVSSLYVKKQNKKKKNDIAIMKSYGYEKKDIIKFSLGSLSCLMAISFVIGIILFFITLIMLKIIFKNFLLENHIYIGIYISPYMTALIILMTVTIITNYFTINKLSKRQTLSIIKE